MARTEFAAAKTLASHPILLQGIAASRKFTSITITLCAITAPDAP
jgi:hypothetical protein